MKTRGTSALLRMALGAVLVSFIWGVSSFFAPGRSSADSTSVPSQHVDDVFDIANEEYKAGNFEDAVRLYQGLLAGPGPKNADMHYNLGNAYYKLHEYGKAIASYRRALRLAPRDEDIHANLRHVRSMTVDKIDQPKGTELLREILFFHYGVSRPEAEGIFLCGYFAAALLGAVCLWQKPRFLRLLAYTALAVAIIFVVSTVTRVYRAANPNEAVVVVEEADVHTGPGDNYMVSFDIHDGTEMETRKRQDGWFQVELPDGRRGWIRASQLEVIS